MHVYIWLGAPLYPPAVNISTCVLSQHKSTHATHQSPLCFQSAARPSTRQALARHRQHQGCWCSPWAMSHQRHPLRPTLRGGCWRWDLIDSLFCFLGITAYSGANILLAELSATSLADPDPWCLCSTTPSTSPTPTGLSFALALNAQFPTKRSVGNRCPPARNFW